MKFSIITITYNRAHLIKETIESVLNQTYQNFEMIIVDDGSTDNTKKVLTEYIEKYGSKFCYIPHKHIGMLSVLRNIAIKNATGDILTVLDSDDLWLPSKLEDMYHIFSKNPDVNFVFHNFQHFKKANAPSKPYYKFNTSFYKNVLNEILTDKILAFPVYSMRRKLIKEIGFVNEEVIEGQNEYYIKAAALYKIYYHDVPLTLMRRHDQNFTKKLNIIHNLDALKTYKDFKKRKILTNNQYILASNLVDYKTASLYFKKNEPEKAVQHLNEILKRSPVTNKWYIKSKVKKYLSWFKS